MLWIISISSVDVTLFSSSSDNLSKKDELLKTQDIIINDHCGEFISTTDGCERITEIIDIDKYSEEEKKEIYKVVYEDDEDEIVYDESVLEEEYDWVLDDTIYEIVGGFTLEE